LQQREPEGPELQAPEEASGTVSLVLTQGDGFIPVRASVSADTDARVAVPLISSAFLHGRPLGCLNCSFPLLMGLVDCLSLRAFLLSADPLNQLLVDKTPGLMESSIYVGRISQRSALVASAIKR